MLPDKLTLEIVTPEKLIFIPCERWPPSLSSKAANVSPG